MPVLTSNLVREKRAAILQIAQRYGASNVRIIGSVARNQATAKSDLDLIVRFEPSHSLLDHGGLVMDLRELLGIRVDVIDEDAVGSRFRDHVMREAVAL